jgi:hypothetical protein
MSAEWHNEEETRRLPLWQGRREGLPEWRRGEAVQVDEFAVVSLEIFTYLLRLFLGLCMHCARFLHNLSGRLLHRGAPRVAAQHFHFGGAAGHLAEGLFQLRFRLVPLEFHEENVLVLAPLHGERLDPREI